MSSCMVYATAIVIWLAIVVGIAVGRETKKLSRRIQALEAHAGLRADSLTAKASREMGSE